MTSIGCIIKSYAIGHSPWSASTFKIRPSNSIVSQGITRLRTLKKKIKLKLFRASNLGRVSCNKQSPCKKDKEALLPGHLPWMADPSLLSLVLSYQLIMLYWSSWASYVALRVKNLPANAGDVRDTGSFPGSGRSPGGGHSIPLQYSCLENPVDRGAWWARVHMVAKSWIWLNRLCTQECFDQPTWSAKVTLILQVRQLKL